MGDSIMGGFLKQIAQLGMTGAATAYGGPAAGAGVAAGMGMLGSALSGGSLGDIFMKGATNAGSAYLGGKLAVPKPSLTPPIPDIPNFGVGNLIDPNSPLLGTLNGLRFNY